jgi:hypothetical protein
LCRREFETSANVLGLKVRKISQNCGFSLASGKKFEHIDHPNSHSTNAGSSSTLLGIEGNSIEMAHENKLPGFDVKSP